MRWYYHSEEPVKLRPAADDGSNVVAKRFLWLPTVLPVEPDGNWEGRWLETAEVRYVLEGLSLHHEESGPYIWMPWRFVS